MLMQDCRIENFNGFKFYEKDILYDNYTFTNNIQIEVDLLYCSPGFGIALMDNEGSSIKEKNNVYLFKSGYKEASIYYSTPINTTLIKQTNCLEAYTVQEHMKFKFIKTGKKVTILINDVEVFSEYLKRDLDKYNIGYYSNAGNIINDIKITSNIPNGWTVNMANTIGGHISFATDEFTISNCINDAEIEQSKIFLKKGMYYFSCENVPRGDKESDIEVFIYPSDERYIGTPDNRFHDEKKNILNRTTGVLLIKEDMEVTLKFRGTNGTIKEIMISEHRNDEYIPTTTNSIEFKGSYIDVFLSQIKKITWKGTIRRTPGDNSSIDSSVVYGLILDNRTQIRPLDAKLSYGIEYDFEFNTDKYELKVRREGVITHPNEKFILKNLSNKVTIFKNITAEITEFILYKKNGEQININVQDENKKYVNADIESPVLVVDQYDIPLDLSSSYRLAHFEDHSRYVFTNWEREYFKPAKKLTFENKVLSQQDTIIAYGIKKGFKYDFSKLYDIPKSNINSIDLMTRDYDVFYETDLLFVDKTIGVIYLQDSVIEKYELIIVDYLKNDSYCINFEYDKNVYEVNISSKKNNNKILYDSMLVSSIDDKGIYQVNKHLITNISGNTNGYVVIRKGDDY